MGNYGILQAVPKESCTVHSCRGRLALSFCASSSALDLKRALLLAQRKMCRTSRVTESQISYREENMHIKNQVQKISFIISAQMENQTNSSPYTSGKVSMAVKRIYITVQKNRLYMLW